MIHRNIASWLLVGQVLGLCMTPAAARAAGSPTHTLLHRLPPGLKALATEVLEQNPDIARARYRAAAAETRAPQVRSLPDPVATVGLFLLPPETRVGPQRLSLSVSQKLPWMGKLDLREQAALYGAVAARERVEEARLAALTETRRLAHELAFLDDQRRIVETERASLVRYEKAAQARYSAGTGLQQGIVRIQAQITRADVRLLEIAERRATILAALNALRDRPAGTPVDLDPGADPTVDPRGLDTETLIARATVRRPDVRAAEAESEAARVGIRLAEKGFRPDFSVGLSFTAVDGRDDAAGRASPPEGNGDDVLALTGSLNLPVRRDRLRAALEQAQAESRAADEHRRMLVARANGAIGDLATRIPMLAEHLELVESVLLKQARESLRSAETAYSLGRLDAVDLLDAEVVLFEVRIAARRTRADLAVAVARLEKEIAGPLPDLETETFDPELTEGSSHEP